MDHQDPVTDQRGNIGTGYSREAEPDTLGVDAQTEDPALFPPGGGYWAEDYAEWVWDDYNTDPECYVDGLLTNCEAAQDMIEAGAAEQCPDNNCGSQWNWETGQLEIFRSFADGFSGYMSVNSDYLGDGAVWNPWKKISPEEPLGELLQLSFLAPSEQQQQTGQRQKDPLPEPKELRKNVENLITDDDCAKFIAGLLSSLLSTKEKQVLITPDEARKMVLRTFDKVAQQGGFRMKETPTKTFAKIGAWAEAVGSIKRKTATVYYNPFENDPDIFGTTLHETVHHTKGDGRWTDLQLSTAAAFLPGATRPYPKPNNSPGNPGPYSEYFDGELDRNCK